MADRAGHSPTRAQSEGCFPYPYAAGVRTLILMSASVSRPLPTTIETAPPADGLAADRALREPVTLRTIQKMRERGEPFACLTCYDATTAKLFERAGVPLLLVGDTAAEMILGLPGTIHAPLDFLITL